MEGSKSQNSVSHKANLSRRAPISSSCVLRSTHGHLIVTCAADSALACGAPAFVSHVNKSSRGDSIVRSGLGWASIYTNRAPGNAGAVSEFMSTLANFLPAVRGFATGTMAEHTGPGTSDSSSLNEAPHDSAMGTMAEHSGLCTVNSSSVIEAPRDFALGAMAEHSRLCAADSTWAEHSKAPATIRLDLRNGQSRHSCHPSSSSSGSRSGKQ